MHVKIALHFTAQPEGIRVDADCTHTALHDDMQSQATHCGMTAHGTDLDVLVNARCKPVLLERQQRFTKHVYPRALGHLDAGPILLVIIIIEKVAVPRHSGAIEILSCTQEHDELHSNTRYCSMRSKPVKTRGWLYMSGRHCLSYTLQLATGVPAGWVTLRFVQVYEHATACHIAALWCTPRRPEPVHTFVKPGSIPATSSS